MAQFLDRAKCPQGHVFAIFRMGKSAGKMVATYCSRCNKMFKARARNPIDTTGPK
jgi:hypothetical protein